MAKRRSKKSPRRPRYPGEQRNPPKAHIVRKLIMCGCSATFDLTYQRGRPGVMVIEKQTIIVETGRKFQCTGCHTVHDADREGKRAPISGLGTFCK